MFKSIILLVVPTLRRSLSQAAEVAVSAVAALPRSEVDAWTSA